MIIKISLNYGIGYRSHKKSDLDSGNTGQKRFYGSILKKIFMIIL